MSLINLVKAKQLKEEAFDKKEFLGLLNFGKIRLKDSQNPSLSPDSSFDLAYNATHSLALAALRCMVTELVIVILYFKQKNESAFNRGPRCRT